MGRDQADDNINKDGVLQPAARIDPEKEKAKLQRNRQEARDEAAGQKKKGQPGG